MSIWPRLTERLEGQLVIVEPLADAHEDGLFNAGQDQDVWQYLTFPECLREPGALPSLDGSGAGHRQERGRRRLGDR